VFAYLAMELEPGNLNLLGRFSSKESH
jgi:hypothetical protein